MIDKNLGNIERVIRLMIGLVFAGWFVFQPGLTVVDWFVVAVALMLIMNGIFSRCYLWYIIDVNSCKGAERHLG